ncbi:MAG: helix-turn-helix domain-containing protein [Clostridia bacterium]|nr:helix-turn-helix domain-containing protein [Clostridia bacterium]
MKAFEMRLRELRIEHGLSQEDVAAKIYVTKQAVSKWENGLSMPDVATLGSLAELYGTTVDYLLTGEDKVRVEERIVEKVKLVELERRLSDEERERILYKLYRIQYSLCFFIGIDIFMFIATLIMEILYPLWGLILVFVFIVALVSTLITWRLYKREKSEVLKVLRNKFGRFNKNKNLHDN